jgi:hypothetical protein
VNGVSNHGRGRAENDVEKSHHGVVKREAAVASYAFGSLFIALFVTHRRGGFANECLFFKTRCSLRNRTRSRGCA